MSEASGSVHRGATMRDVATLAGVGLATVSRVVNGKSGVAPDLVERVTDAARMLGYRHDHTASSLRRADRRTYTIGMIVENVANPFSSALHRAVEDAAEERGLLLVSGSNDEDPGRERRLIENFTERRVDGLIVVPTGHATDELLAAARRGISLVCVDRAPGFDNVDSVTVDNREGVRDAVRRLHEIGHQRIAYLGDLTRIWTARERYAGFVEGIALAGGPLDERLVRHEIHREQDAYQVALEYFSLDSPPSAILSAQNLITVGARRALQVLGLERRIAQIGFDDIPLADLLVPKVSAIAQNMHELGRKAAELLFARLDGDQSPPRQVVLPTRYIARGSGEIPPTRVWP